MNNNNNNGINHPQPPDGMLSQQAFNQAMADSAVNSAHDPGWNTGSESWLNEFLNNPTKTGLVDIPPANASQQDNPIHAVHPQAIQSPAGYHYAVPPPTPLTATFPHRIPQASPAAMPIFDPRAMMDPPAPIPQHVTPDAVETEVRRRLVNLLHERQGARLALQKELLTAHAGITVLESRKFDVETALHNKNAEFHRLQDNLLAADRETERLTAPLNDMLSIIEAKRG